MGLIHADIELSNARDDVLLPMNVSALVDSGALHLCLPQQIATQLQLPVMDRRSVTIADGKTRMVDHVGPVRITFANRQCMVGALVHGNEALLGAIPMEDMDLVISSSRRSVTVNPASPNIAASVAMGFRTQHA